MFGKQRDRLCANNTDRPGPGSVPAVHTCTDIHKGRLASEGAEEGKYYCYTNQKIESMK